MRSGGRQESKPASRCSLLFAVIALAMFSACSKPSEPAAAPTSGTSGAATAAAGAATTTAAVAGGAPAGGAVRYVANSGGLGVRYRVECQDGALYPGGFAEGDAVNLEHGGTGDCVGWSVVTKGVARSWIRDGYLSDQQPVVRAAAPQGAPTGGGAVPAGSGAPQIPAFAASFQSPVGATITVAELNGEAIIQGGPGGFTYMGVLSSSRTAPDSICNPNGPYGGTAGPNSIRNPRGQFGMAPSEYSAYDPTAPDPPKIRMKNATVGYLSKGAVPGRGNVDPDFLFRALGC